MRSALKLWLAFFLMLLSLGCSAQIEKTYHNQFMGFKVTYPAKYEIKEYRSAGMQLSAELKSKEETIDIRIGGAGTMYAEMPFDQYVKIAAIDQIQNYDQLISIKPFVSDSGVRGYETYWKALQTVPPEDFDKPKDLYPPYISGPIYYFQPQEPKYDGHQPLKTISLSHYATNDNTQKIVVNDLKKIAKSFRF